MVENAGSKRCPRRSVTPHPSDRSQRGLDWLQFFVADVETAFGPFVALYLTTEGWSQGAIGTAITVNSSVAVPPGDGNLCTGGGGMITPRWSDA